MQIFIKNWLVFGELKLECLRGSSYSETRCMFKAFVFAVTLASLSLE